jgi:hypothetical protein
MLVLMKKYLSIDSQFCDGKMHKRGVEFVGCERADRNFAPLQDLDGRVYEIIDTFKAKPDISFPCVWWTLYASELRPRFKDFRKVWIMQRSKKRSKILRQQQATPQKKKQTTFLRLYARA